MARALALLDFEEVDAALERLAHGTDFNVRRRAALASLAQINKIDFSKDEWGRDLPIDRQTLAW